MKRIIKYLVLGVIALVFVGTLVFLYRKSQQAPVVFQLDSPAQMTIVKKTVATGKVIPRREIEVKAQVSGVVEKLYVAAGPDRQEGRHHRAHLAAPEHAQRQRGGGAGAVGAGSTCSNQAADLERYKKLLATEADLRIAVQPVRRPTTTCRRKRWRRPRTRCCC